MGLYVFSEGFWGIGFGGWWCRAGLGLELVIAGAELRVPGVGGLGWGCELRRLCAVCI